MNSSNNLIMTAIKQYTDKINALEKENDQLKKNSLNFDSLQNRHDELKKAYREIELENEVLVKSITELNNDRAMIESNIKKCLNKITKRSTNFQKKIVNINDNQDKIKEFESYLNNSVKEIKKKSMKLQKKIVNNRPNANLFFY
jgi:chromosome segregation ATPase